MKRVDIGDLSDRLPEPLVKGTDEPIVITKQGTPVGVVFPTPNADWETVSLSLDQDFIALI